MPSMKVRGPRGKPFYLEHVREVGRKALADHGIGNGEVRDPKQVAFRRIKREMERLRLSGACNINSQAVREAQVSKSEPRLLTIQALRSDSLARATSVRVGDHNSGASRAPVCNKGSGAAKDLTTEVAVNTILSTNP